MGCFLIFTRIFNRLSLLILIYILSQPVSVLGQYIKNEPFAHTFSIVAIDTETGDMGIAVQSHWFSVGNTVAWAEAGVGVIATQAVVNLDFGPQGLALLRTGMSADQVLDSLWKSDPGREMRQVAVLSLDGKLAVNTGKGCVGEAGHKKGATYSVQANTAESTQVWAAMGEAFEKKRGALAEKMIAALEAAQAMGGDIRGKQSASLLIVKGKATGKPWLDRKIDLRVDDHQTPIAELKRLYQVQSAYNSMNLGFHFLAKDELDAAGDHFNQAQKLYPENQEIMFWYAVELANKGALDRALPVFKTIFDKEVTWKTKMLPRIVKAGVLQVSPETLNKIKLL